MKKQTVNVYTCPNCRREMKNDKLGSLNDYLVVCESCGWRGWTNNVIVEALVNGTPLGNVTPLIGEPVVTMYDGWTPKSERGVKHEKDDSE